MIEASRRWKDLHPGAMIGALRIRGAANPARSEELDRLAEGIESGLRDRFQAGGKEGLRTHPVLAAYEAYYKRFRKTYHVALQVQSVVWKARPIPSAGALVKAMFAVELSNLLLTAGHDLEKLELPLRVDAGTGAESYAALDGGERTVKESDMMILDTRGVISSIIGGPDRRTCIEEATRDVLFVVYAPAGIPETAVRSHLADIERFVRVVAPAAVAESRDVVCAS